MSMRRLIDGLMDVHDWRDSRGRIDGQTDERRDGQMGGWTVGQDRYRHTYEQMVMANQRSFQNERFNFLFFFEYKISISVENNQYICVSAYVSICLV